MQAATDFESRQFGLDWLRIGAFALLILYHIGMFFSPWGWHVTASGPVEWTVWPMMAVNPWRLMLLFVISGFVSRAMLARLAAPGRFAASRTRRLAIPLVAGVAVFVAPQAWFELRDRGAYAAGFLHFWVHDYFEFGASRGMVLPTWNHLWFVAYLWVYTLVLAGLAALPQALRGRLQAVFDSVFSGWRLALVPMLWLAWARIVLHPRFGETHALFDDPYAHAIYGFAFVFGVGLARSTAALGGIDARWRSLAGAAVLALAVLFAVQGAGAAAPGQNILRAAARAVLAWSAILALIGFARARLHHDGPVRRYLTEAVFPYYIVHQTIIIAAGFWVKQAEVSNGPAFAAILLATVGGCVITHEAGRRIGWLRPVLGLKPPAPSPGPAHTRSAH